MKTGKDSRRFQRGSGIYTCEYCGKKTRYTGSDAYSVRLCDYCFELCNWENTYSDGLCKYEDIPEEYRNQISK